MSHIQSTGIARVQVQQLTCARKPATTDSVISDIDSSTDILILLLQERWTNSRARPPPPSKNYDIYTPTNCFPKCATYIQKNINIQARNVTAFGNHSMKITITNNKSDIDIFNIYSSGRFLHITKILQHLSPHRKNPRAPTTRPQRLPSQRLQCSPPVVVCQPRNTTHLHHQSRRPRLNHRQLDDAKQNDLRECTRNLHPFSLCGKIQHIHQRPLFLPRNYRKHNLPLRTGPRRPRL